MYLCMKASLPLISEVGAPPVWSEETSPLDDEGLAPHGLLSLPEAAGTPPHRTPLSPHFDGMFPGRSLGGLPSL